MVLTSEIAITSRMVSEKNFDGVAVPRRVPYIHRSRNGLSGTMLPGECKEEVYGRGRKTLFFKLLV